MYKTELTEKILQSPMAQKVIQEISPIYGEAYTVLWLIQIIGAVLDKMNEWTGSIAEQVVPQTATWSLSYWEEQYDIYADPSWSIEKRRQNILNKCRKRAPINPKKLEDMLSELLGSPVSIRENVAKNTFEVVTEEYIRDLSEAIELLDKISPAHLIYRFNAEVKVQSLTTEYYNIMVSELESFEVSIQQIYTLTDENGVELADENENILVYTKGE